MDTAHVAMKESPQAKKHAFAAFDEDMRMVACGVNRFPTSKQAEDAGYPWGAHHAEFDLFSNNLDLKNVSFYIGVRVNRFREFRCSVPCPICSSMYGLSQREVYSIDWNGNIVIMRNSGSTEFIGKFPGGGF